MGHLTLKEDTLDGDTLNENTIDEDTIDDLLYFARTADTAELHNTLEQATNTHGTTSRDVLIAAKDVNSGNTALHMAAANGHSETIAFLLSSLRLPDTTEATESVPSAYSFLNARNNSGNTPLHWAALNGHLHSVQILAEAGADLLLKNNAGHDAAYEAELAEKENVVTWLLKAQNEDGNPGNEQETDTAEEVEDGMTDGTQPAE